METGLIGTDVSPIAAHLTSASLAAIGTGEPYGSTRIGWVKVGGRLSAIGSLDYFKKDEIRDLWDSVAGSSTGAGDGKELSVHIPDDSIDWILMNPPYSRTRGGQSAFDIAGLSKVERDACQNKWKEAVKNEPVKRTAGMAASFLALARKKVKPGGRIGFVLPLTAAFAESWEKTRRMLEREFSDITALAVAAGQALGKDALSADTGMEEMILVATRRKKSSAKSALIKCVTLYRPVTKLGEAGETARAVFRVVNEVDSIGLSKPITVGETEIGQVYAYDAGNECAPWGPLGAIHTGLAIAADRMTRGRLEFLDKSMDLDIGMTTLEELFHVGPTHDMIGHLHGGDGRGAFEFFKVKGRADAVGADRAMWAADGGNKRSLVVLPTHKGVSVDNRKSREMRARKAKLFYARGMSWGSQALLAATTKHAALGGRAWTALGHDDPRVRNAFALWANSTLGMIVHWTRGQRTQAGRSPTQIRALSRIPCPRLDRLGDSRLNNAAAMFDEMASLRLSPACHAHADEARWKIDLAVIDMLGLPDDANEIVEALRFLWCCEPSVVRSNDKKALAHLAARDDGPIG